jgi:hypothetical protein
LSEASALADVGRSEEQRLDCRLSPQAIIDNSRTCFDQSYNLLKVFNPLVAVRTSAG